MIREITEEDLGSHPALVCAHPDDECLWAGGLLARFRHLPWTVLCCSTPRIDPIRAQRFLKACEMLGAQWALNATIEGEPGQPIPGLDEMLRGALDSYAPDCVVTHGVFGEYGHNQHVQVHHAVLDAFPGRVLGFGWHKGGQGALSLTLTDAELALKDAALDCYGIKAAALRKRYYKELRVPEDRESYDIYRE